MKKFIIIFLLIFLVSCHYSPNKRINQRTPPVVVVAIDPEYSSVLLKDGDNNVFTIYKTATTKAISKSLIEGDTIREDENGRIVKITSGNF